MAHVYAHRELERDPSLRQRLFDLLDAAAAYGAEVLLFAETHPGDLRADVESWVSLRAPHISMVAFAPAIDVDGAFVLGPRGDRYPIARVYWSSKRGA